MDVLFLSRLQFAVTAGFHYIFPPISIGLSVVLIWMEGVYLKTGNPLYHQMTRFWVKIFALVFALGVASGIVMEFQFGTNWSTYSRFVGDVFGSALAAEGILAFFLESVFLGLLLFGWDKVSKGMHFFATIMVSVGAHLSAVWILVANSWMHTPAGHVLRGGRAEISDFWGVVFNPSTLERIAHVYGGAWLAGAFLVLAVSAFYILKNRHLDFAKTSMKIGLVFAVLSALFQLGTGHLSTIGVSKNQPVKLAAFEGHFEKSAPGDLFLFGWVDEKKERVQLGLRLPGMLSFLVSGEPKKPLVGLRSVAAEDRPPLNLVFQSYHLMVAIGMGLILLTWLGVLVWVRGTLFNTRWLLWLFVVSALGPQIANQVGWISAEVGRQPYIIQGIMRTKDAFSPVLSTQEVWMSLLLFVAIYLLLLFVFVFLLFKKINDGPEDSRFSLGDQRS